MQELFNLMQNEHGLILTETEMNEILTISKNIIDAQKEPVANFQCSDGLSAAHKNDLIMAFAEGYEAGHNDTVESAYTDATDRAIDWFIEAKEAGIIQGT